MPDAEYNICEVCCHCRNGIPYGDFHTWCLDCNFVFCSGCVGEHPESHRNAFRECCEKMLTLESEMHGYACYRCGDRCDIRMECNGCTLKFCLYCREEAPILEDHEHKEFTVWRGLDDYKLPKYDFPCESCELGLTIAHCGRCLEGIRVGEKTYECRDCTDIFGASRAICEACLPVVKAEHVADHEWMSGMYREIEHQDEDYYGGRCNDCEQTMWPYTESKLAHPHKDFAYEMGCLERQHRSFAAIRSCARRTVRDNHINEEDRHVRNLNCVCCSHPFSKHSRMHFCLRCDYLACDYCYNSGVLRHQHPMFDTYLKGSIPPEDFWEDMASHKHTRTCDLCKEDILYRFETHLRCRACDKFDICQQCMNLPETSTSHVCGEWPDMNLMDPKDMGRLWVLIQTAKARAFLEEPEETDEEWEQEEEANCIRQGLLEDTRGMVIDSQSSRPTQSAALD